MKTREELNAEELEQTTGGEDRSAGCPRGISTAGAICFQMGVCPNATSTGRPNEYVCPILLQTFKAPMPPPYATATAMAQPK